MAIPPGFIPRVSIGNIVRDAAVQLNPTEGPSGETLAEALRNLLVNTGQNRTIPLLTQQMQDSIDSMAMEMIARLYEENPRALQLILGSGSLPDNNPIDQVISGGVPPRAGAGLEDLAQLGEYLGGRFQNRAPRDLGPEDVGRVGQLLGGLQNRVRASRQNPELNDLMSYSSEVADTVPGQRPQITDLRDRVEHIIGSMQYNNNFRAMDPINAGSRRNSVMRLGNDEAFFPLLSALKELEATGIPRHEIYQQLLHALDEFDQAGATGDTLYQIDQVAAGRELPQDEPIGAWSDLLDEEALMREIGAEDPGSPEVAGWPAGVSAWAEPESIPPRDPEVILRALGLRRPPREL